MPVFESSFSTFHGRSDDVANFWIVDRAYTLNLAVSGCVDSKIPDKFGRTVDNNVRVVTCEYQLPLLLCSMKFVGQLRDDLVVQIAFRLINFRRAT